MCTQKYESTALKIKNYNPALSILLENTPTLLGALLNSSNKIQFAAADTFNIKTG